MSGKIFEYAVLYHPKPRKVGDETVTDPSTIIVPLAQIVANDMQSATIMAARDIPTEYVTKLDQVEIAIRPF